MNLCFVFFIFIKNNPLYSSKTSACAHFRQKCHNTLKALEEICILSLLVRTSHLSYCQFNSHRLVLLQLKRQYLFLVLASQNIFAAEKALQFVTVIAIYNLKKKALDVSNSIFLL